MGNLVEIQGQIEKLQKQAAEIKARESAWADESERRVESYERGDLKARDAAQVFEELQKKLRQ